MYPHPLILYTTAIKPEWLDYNQHMNVAYYLLIFDLAMEELLRSLGLGEKAARNRNISVMVLEAHILYDREVSLGQTVEVSAQLVDHDRKRLHLYLEMHVQGGGGYRAARLEQLLLGVDLKQRRAASFPEDVMTGITRLAQCNAGLARPESLGRTIGIRR